MGEDDVWGTEGDGTGNDGWSTTDTGLNVLDGDTYDYGTESGTDLLTPGEDAIQAQEDFYALIGIDPASMSDAPPETIAKINSIIAGDAYKASPDLLKTIAGAFKKTVNGKEVYDWDKVGLVGGLLAKATGLTKPETPGYKGTVKNYEAVRKAIDYTDPNRRPGSGGRQYFTDTQYASTPAEVAAAKAKADEQAAGIMAGYTPAAVPTSKWNATNSLAMPWVRPAQPAAAAPAPAPGIMTPEEKLASVQPKTAAQGGIMEAAKGRYLRGNTDGMADKINTSIDGHQPAKLSHGEFVVPADVVSHLGNGNSDAGAKKLYQMMDKIRIARTGTKKQGREIDPDKFMPGGSVGYSSGGGIMDGIQRFATGGPATNTSTAGNLSEWAGDAITTNIGQGIAAANQPYQAYKGPLTAGASDLQQQQFAGISNLAQTGVAPTQYTKGTFGVEQAQQYMNPYIQTALDPQLKEMQRQADIARLSDAGRLTKAGAYGGSRQAIMESEGRRNLLDKQMQAIGTGYANAYDKAAAQYNADMNRGLATEQAQQAANMDSANYSRGILQDLGQAGATQRAIEAEGIKADKDQFEEARDWDMKMAQYKQGLFSGMPTATQVNTTNQNPITEWLQSGKTLSELLDSFNKP